MRASPLTAADERASEPARRQAAGIPSPVLTLTFADSLTLHFNGDDIDLIHLPSRHTDGDVIVRLRQADVLFAPGLFNNGDFTRVDLCGDRLDGMIVAYQQLPPAVDDRSRWYRAADGCARKGTWRIISPSRIALRDHFSQLIFDGKSIDEVVALKPIADLDPKWGNGPIRPD